MPSHPRLAPTDLSCFLQGLFVLLHRTEHDLHLYKTGNEDEGREGEYEERQFPTVVETDAETQADAAHGLDAGRQLGTSRLQEKGHCYIEVASHECHGVSNHRQLCLFNNLFRPTT